MPHCMIKTGLLWARFLWSVWLFFLLCASLPAVGYGQQAAYIKEVPASPELLRVRTLIRSNVLELAQRIMEQQGPALLPSGEWLNWERQLWALYQTTGNWQKLYDRVQGIPPAFPAAIRLEGEQQAIGALVALGDGARARRLLRRQLLSTSISERDKSALRRQVIESYLVDQLVAEANVSARLYQQDFRAQDKSWLLLAARIALQSGEPDEAVNLLAPVDEPEARLLRTYARLKNNTLSPSQVIENGRQFRDQKAYKNMQRAVLAMMVNAAQISGPGVEQIDLLEQYLDTAVGHDELLNRAMPRYGVTDLVKAYSVVAVNQANRAGYLAGEENTWIDFARLIPTEQGQLRRSVWSHISVTANNPVIRQLGIDNFINAAIDSDRTSILHDLFGDGAILGPLELAPATALRLSNVAIEKGDVQLAADANANVSGPPPGMEFADWLIYTGRIAIIAGRHEEGASQLEKWVNGFERLTPEQTDSILQPVFDLQTVNQHALAIPLLLKIDKRSPGGKYTREIAFWIAESYSATKQHIKAADYFLFSAMQKENGFDQWGESARFRAADALLEGNLFSDARTLFEDLLERAGEEQRKQSLQQKLQQLWLRESSLQPSQNSVPQS